MICALIFAALSFYIIFGAVRTTYQGYTFGECVHETFMMIVDYILCIFWPIFLLDKYRKK